MSSELELLLQQSLVYDESKAAEKKLKQLEILDGFSLELLKLTSQPQINLSIRLAAALYFKNLLRRKWTDDAGNHLLPPNDVDAIKHEIVGFMIQLPSTLQAQIGEAISIIADSDFPHQWDYLINDLVNRLSFDSSDLKTAVITNLGVFRVAHSIFGRWRALYASDDLLREIKLVLDSFCDPFLKVFQFLDSIVNEATATQPKLDKPLMQLVFESLDLATQIFFDLNFIDLPEFFEDNMPSFMSLFHKYLVYESPHFPADDGDDDEPTPVIQFKASICEAIELYVKKYEEEFASLVPQFTQSTCLLLTQDSIKTKKHDILVTKALAFLTSVVASPHSDLFQEESVLRNLVENIILPNMVLQDSDEESFEDDPIEFIRAKLDESDCRRQSTSEFVRVLCNKFEGPVTELSMSFVNLYLQQYANGATWKAKDTAIFLFSSIAIKGSTAQTGVTTTNLLVDIVGFFVNNIANDLIQPGTNKFLVVDAIHYIYTFRNQLTKDQLSQMIGPLVNHLSSSEYVIYTFSAIALERLLAIRANFGTGPVMFSKSDVPAESAKQLISQLFALIEQQKSEPTKMQENEFLARAIMRLIIVVQDNCKPYCIMILENLMGIISIIQKNPSNPKFSHYLFESLGALVRFAYEPAYEQIVFPVFQEILANDVTEFTPYVLQILAQILHNETSLSSNYEMLIGPIISPSAWESRGNIPGLVRLLREMLAKDAAKVVSAGGIGSLLGIFQKLIASKANDSFGVDLLEDIFKTIPINALMEKRRDIALLFLQRLQSLRTDSFEVRFSRFILKLSAVLDNGAEYVIEMFDLVQAGIFGQLFAKFILPNILKIASPVDRKVSSIGLSNILFTTAMLPPTGMYQSEFLAGLSQEIMLLSTEIPAELDDVYLTEMRLNEDDLSATTHNELSTVSTKVTDPFPQIDEKIQFVNAIKRADEVTNGEVFKRAQLLEDPEVRNKLWAMLGQS